MSESQRSNDQSLTDASWAIGPCLVRALVMNVVRKEFRCKSPPSSVAALASSESESESNRSLLGTSSKCLDPDTDSNSGLSGWNATDPIASTFVPE